MLVRRPARALFVFVVVFHAAAVFGPPADRTESKKLVAVDASPTWDHFGKAVAISGTTVVVGAPSDERAGAEDTGAAYVFERDQGGVDNWGQVAKLVASDAAPEDRFGRSVAISGTTVVVGADLNLDAGRHSGSAYVFERDEGGADNWGEVAKLTASDAAPGDRFGEAVAISGSTVVVGAPAEDTGHYNAGAAYVFERNQGGANSWGQVAKIENPFADQDDMFGWAVAISGSTIVVGAYNHDSSFPSGLACVFERNHGGADNWGWVATLAASDATRHARFGKSVAASDDTVVVGAEYAAAAYVFERDLGGPNNWGEAKNLIASDAATGDYFGNAVAISGDTVVVGAKYQDGAASNAGAAYTFERNEGGAANWGEVDKLTASDALESSFFGSAVAVSGNNFLVGAPRDDRNGDDAGAAYVYAGSRTAPGAATPTSPLGATSETTPTYSWPAVVADAVPGRPVVAPDAATRYQLWVDGPAGTVIKIWYTAALAGCAGGGTCSVTPPTVLVDGDHNWWLQTYNEYGYGPWSTSADFTVVSTVPAAPVLLSPDGTVATSTPLYLWNGVTGATWYYLWVENAAQTPVVQQWYTAVQVGCQGGGACSVTPPTGLSDGSHSGWVRPWNTFGLGPWSTRTDFTVDTSTPAAAILVAPVGLTVEATPTYTWAAVANATWYYLWVDGPGGTVIQQWYTAAGAGCASGVGICMATPSTVLASGAHSWWIRTWNPAGHGPWSSRMDFTYSP